MHLDQSALGILRKAEDKCGRKYMDWRIPYMDQPGLIMVYKSDQQCGYHLYAGCDRIQDGYEHAEADG